MTMPFYVSPEQLMKDRADYARKGIARGRSVVVLEYADGIAFVAENPSRALHKISEIYDRIGFAAVGKYNEFENLRVAGVRYADLRGYSYDRADVTARGLANAYAQTLGTVFTTESKPLEVEIVVAEVGRTPDRDQIYRLAYDGSVADERGVVVMGGLADQVAGSLRERWLPGMDLAAALALALSGLSPEPAGATGNGAGTGSAAAVPGGGTGSGTSATAGGARRLGVDALEVAVLERDRPRRAFRRISGAALAALIDGDAPPAPAAEQDPAGRGGGSGTPGGHSGLPGDAPPR